MSNPMKSCPSCRSANPRSARYCGQCGVAFPIGWRVVATACIAPFALLGLVWALQGVFDYALATPPAYSSGVDSTPAQARPALERGKVSCPRCGGRGTVDYVSYSSISGALRESRLPVACPRCGGRGWMYEAELLQNHYE